MPVVPGVSQEVEPSAPDNQRFLTTFSAVLPKKICPRVPIYSSQRLHNKQRVMRSMHRTTRV